MLYFDLCGGFHEHTKLGLPSDPVLSSLLPCPPGPPACLPVRPQDAAERGALGSRPARALLAGQLAAALVHTVVLLPLMAGGWRWRQLACGKGS